MIVKLLALLVALTMLYRGHYVGACIYSLLILVLIKLEGKD